MDQHVTIPTPAQTMFMPNTAADGGLPSQEHRVFPRFFVEQRYNETKSNAAGRPITDDVEMVKIIIAGQNSAEPIRKVTDTDRTRRWPREYAAWKAAQRGQITLGGLPIDIWPGLQTDQIIQLKILNIFTVEQLANVTDANLGHLGLGARELREKARQYLKEADEGAALRRAETENADLRKRLMAMETAVAQLNAQQSGFAPALAEGAPAKRKGWPKGKPRKAKTDAAPEPPKE